MDLSLRKLPVGLVTLSHNAVIVAVLSHQRVRTHPSRDGIAEDKLGEDSTKDLTTVTPFQLRGLSDCAIACILSRFAIYHDGSRAYMWGDLLHV